jgi:hypothetical protein
MIKGSVKMLSLTKLLQQLNGNGLSVTSVRRF